MERLAAVVALLLLAAGCSSPEPSPSTTGSPTPMAQGPPTTPLVPPSSGPASPPTSPRPPLAFHAPLALDVECAFTCYEPTVAVDGQGRIVVTTTNEPVVWVSEDGGQTFQGHAIPEKEGQLGDNHVQATPAGRLQYSTLASGGVLVASSGNGGRTWENVTYVGLPGRPEPLPLGADRQWVAFGPDGAAYASFSQIPTGLYVARSDDGGARWGPFLPVVTAAERAGIGQAGPVAADADGRLYLPYLDHNPATPGTVMLRISADRGMTWRGAPVAPGTSASATGGWFPIAAAGRAGLAVAWVDARSDLHVSFSTDEGATWMEPRRLNNASAPVGPWMEAGPEGFDVAWFERDGDASSLHVARIPFDGLQDPLRWERALVAEGVSGDSVGTDFAHFSRAPDGRLVVAWSNTASRATYVALERLAGE